MSEFIKIPNSKKFLKRKYFSLKDYKEPYFFKEVKREKNSSKKVFLSI